jgi:uncharacterized protein (TIGR03437 family)
LRAPRVLVLMALLALVCHAQTTFTISTVAGDGKAGFSGDGGPATSASLDAPGRVALDSSGNLYVSDFSENRIRKITPSGIISTIAGNGTAAFGGDGGPATQASLYAPFDIVFDSAGNLYIANSGNNRVRMVNPQGIIATIAGNGNPGYSGDGGQAIGAALDYPAFLAFDAVGDLLVSTNGYNYAGSASVIRKITPAGVISTFAGNGQTGYSGDGGPATSAALDAPKGLAFDPSGNLFIADQGNQRIRKITTAGIISTVAGNGLDGYAGDGGPASKAEFGFPAGIAFDSSGTLYIADRDNNRIRVLLPNGTVSTVAGTGVAGFSGDGGPAIAAEINSPRSVTTASTGAVYLADEGNSRVRLLTPPPSIKPGGVTPIDSPANTIQPGSWISIFGENLASGVALWNGNFPESLAGVSVTIDNKPSYLWYVSPTQINLQAPDDNATGIVSVVVTTPSGSGESTVILGTVGPSFNLLDNKHVAGIILRSDGSGAYGGGTYDILGPTGTSLGYQTVAAKAGDTVELFGVGFGPTSPSTPAGAAYSGAAPTTNPVTLSINSIALTPSFAGIVSAGLYQINILQLPTGLGVGDVPLLATVDGISTPLGVVISLQ